MNKNEELILVTRRSTIDSVSPFQGFQENCEKYLDAIFDKGNTFFTKRGPAETDETLKQIIPYCLIEQEGKLMVYKRGNSGGEDRLKSLYSLGIGGHINPIDSIGNNDAFSRESLNKALLRELNEELEIPKGGISFKTLGLINDDSNGVGRVHFGLVILAQIPPGDVFPKEDAIQDIKLVHKNQLSDLFDNLESWSQIVAINLKSNI
jgi:predicted NUDIX family phosphoesterase